MLYETWVFVLYKRPGLFYKSSGRSEQLVGKLHGAMIRVIKFEAQEPQPCIFIHRRRGHGTLSG